MHNPYSDYCDQFFDHFTDISKRSESRLKKAERIIALTTQSLQELKALVLKHGFSKKGDEIYFFKELKPKVFSQLIYNTKVKQVESTLPYLGYIKDKEKYLANELRNIGLYFQTNLDFCHYLRNDLSYMDEKYFTRGQADGQLLDESFLSITDQDFSTCYDYKVACLLAYDLLTVYLNKKVENIHGNADESFVVNEASLPLRWTGSKIALVELIYALQASGCINHGHAGIKDLKEMFEKVFEIELGDCYRLFLEIKARNHTTKFLDQLCESLNNKIESQDQ
jgi:hypothetical protein